ncbi:MFS transporter [Pseudoduganella lutea]|uniref:MFS transporter n=1 Tax=Pseudoduganella lutea TaxID=321985 RepID=A0A4P6KS36_9BURK|nr:MFS transporter [Pseudoduganella lutea]QBE61921.1 MFS transporter [Pseudoduganella lutea]
MASISPPQAAGAAPGSTATTAAAPDDTVPFKAWIILALLTIESILGIIDRQSISALKTTLMAEFGTDNAGYSMLVNAFLIPYALFYPVCGALVDRYGTRRTLSTFVILWSSATLLCGVARSLEEMIVYRAIIGAAEAGLLPASMMALVIWFPKAKIGTAGSLRSALQSAGPIICTPLIVWITLQTSWHYAFILPGAIGIFFGIAWFFADRNPPAYRDRAGAPKVKARALDILRHPALWGILLARVVSDPLWFFLNYWQAGYLQEKMGLTLKEIGYLLWIAPLVASIIMVGIGIFSDRLVKRGWSPVRSRMRIMQCSAVLAPLIFLVPHSTSLPLVIALLSVAYFVAYLWLVFANIMVTDLFRDKGVGVALGLVNACGTVGASFFTSYVGITLDLVGYLPVFLALACMHPLAAVILQVGYGRRVKAEAAAMKAT